MVKLSMLFCFLALAGLAVPVRAQTNSTSQPVSPPAHAQCILPSGGTVIVDYSSPRMRGRKIFGGLVPYGKVWRAGANEATSFVLSKDYIVGGKTVPAGSYTIFAIPDEQQWTLIVSQKTSEWGDPYPGDDDDFQRMDMTVSRLPAPLENFTISFDRTPTGCRMNLDWETTRASVDINDRIVVPTSPVGSASETNRGNGKGL